MSMKTNAHYSEIVFVLDRSGFMDKNVLLLERFRQRSVTAAVDFVRAMEEKDGKVFVGVRPRHNQRIFGHPRTLQHRVGHPLSYG